MKTFALSVLLFAGIITGAGLPLSTDPASVTFESDDFLVRGESSIAVGDTVVLVPENADGCAITWTPFQGSELIGAIKQTKQPREIVRDNGGQIEFVSLPTNSLVMIPTKPGVIKFQCTCINWDERKFDQVMHTVTVTGKTIPDDGKEDDDDKKDDQTPDPDIQVYDEIWLVLIEESANREASNKILNSVKLDEFCRANKIQKSEYDKDDKKIPRGYLDLAKEEGIPSFILSGVKDGRNKMIVKGTFPATVDELIDQIKGYKVK